MKPDYGIKRVYIRPECASCGKIHKTLSKSSNTCCDCKIEQLKFQIKSEESKKKLAEELYKGGDVSGNRTTEKNEEA